jgi:[acyl-carrier-protein] S-malonyltransferase
MIGKVALLFPGTGSQYVGMMKGKYERDSLVRETFEEAEAELGLPLAAMCFEEGFRERDTVVHAQTAIFVCSVAACRSFLKETGLQPSFMAGHSLGELTALTCAGVFRFRDALGIVRFRGEAMEAAVPDGSGALAAIKHLTAAQVRETCREAAEDAESVWIACLNAPDQTVIAGHREAVDRVSARLTKRGGGALRLSTGVPFHTPLMHPAAERLRELLKQCPISVPGCPVLANATATPYAVGAESVADLLARQLENPVRWQESVRYMQLQGVSYSVELGPKTILTGLVRRTARNIRALAWDEPADRERIAELRRLRPDFLNRCLSIAVSVCNRNDDPASYEREVANPYRELERLRQIGEEEGRPPSLMEMEAALDCLNSILRGKRVEETQREPLLREAKLARELTVAEQSSIIAMEEEGRE